MHANDKRRRSANERFMARVVPEPNSGCWLWDGACLTNGYGRFSPTQRRHEFVYAHRFSYEMHVGAIPDGMVIDHLCRVRCCVNPDHLEAVTRGENVRRGDAPSHVSRRTGICKRGHRYAGRRCAACYADWKEQRDVATLINRIVQRARATAALHQPNQ